jgi:hypothetical protein
MLADEYVSQMRDDLDRLESILRPQHKAPVGFDTAEAIADIQVLRELLDLIGARAALAIRTTRHLDRELAKIIDPVSRGGQARAGKFLHRDLMLWQTARRECPKSLARSDGAAAAWMFKNGKGDGRNEDAMRKALGRIKRKLAEC